MRGERKSRHVRMAAIVLGLGVLAIFALLPSAAATPQPTARAAPALDLSTVPKIKSYLRSLGVDPRSVVIQRGSKNYAGPNCPGAGWSCTDARMVVQVGTQNTVECSPGPGTNAPAGFQECIIVQGSATKNVAKCNQKSTQVPFVRQRCSITQTGRTNEATVVQLADQISGDPFLGFQTLGALQEVGLLQTGTGTTSTNRLKVSQEIKQLSETTGGSVTQDQDAYQVVGDPFGVVEVPTDEAMQVAEGRGDNSSEIAQNQIQRAKGGSMQLQNDGTYVPADPLFGGVPDDCFTESGISPDDPNACVNFEQEGENRSRQASQLTQTIDMEETTTAAGAFQRQHPGEFEGGADGRIHQEIDGSSGVSQNQANQSEKLRMFAPSGADQEQHGGAGCCGFGSQEGGTGNSEQINQQKDLFAEGGTIQTATLVGSSRSPDGNCAVNHKAQTNSDSETESASQRPCFGLVVVTHCENESGESEEEIVGACENTEVLPCPEGTVPDIGEGGPFCDEIGEGSALSTRAFHLRR